MATSKIKARREKVDASEAVQVGKHSRDKVEMWERSPNMVPPAAKASATTCRMSA